MQPWIIIPAHNEDKNIVSVVKKVKSFTKNIVVVDDGSSDKTFEVASKEKIVVLKHIINLGKGAALKTGCDYAMKKGAEVLIAIDADGQHDPKMIPIFLKKLENNDIVFGYRKFDRNMPFVLKLGNFIIGSVVRILYGIKLHDTQGGYRAFTSKAYRKIRWKAQDYSMESEMITNVAKHKLKYSEIPIKTIYANKYKGTTVLDGIKIVIDMFLWKVKR